MMHAHVYHPRWVCEHAAPHNHRDKPCNKGRWIYRCRCGEQGFVLSKLAIDFLEAIARRAG